MNPTPTLWRDMTAAEKGALLLAHHEGKAIEYYGPNAAQWFEATDGCLFAKNAAYRVKPTPTVETVQVNGHVNDWKQFVTDSEVVTHRITFNLIDGKPDCDSIRMESL